MTWMLSECRCSGAFYLFPMDFSTGFKCEKKPMHKNFQRSSHINLLLRCFPENSCIWVILTSLWTLSCKPMVFFIQLFLSSRRSHCTEFVRLQLSSFFKSKLLKISVSHRWFFFFFFKTFDFYLLNSHLLTEAQALRISVNASLVQLCAGHILNIAA